MEMSKNIVIRHNIPTVNKSGAESSINFYRWLPTKKDALIVNKGNQIVKLWIDNSCVYMEAPDKEKIKIWVNIPVCKVFVDIEVQDLSDELIRFIYDERDRPKNIHYGIKPGEGNYDELNNSYKKLGEEVLQSSLEVYNRFVAFVRNNKGQYWLSEHKFDKNRISSMNVEFNSKVSSNNCDWVRWCPPFVDNIIIILSDDDDKISIKENEWKEINQFISGNSRLDLVLELLANTRSLIDAEYLRSAIIEAVSALEVAIDSFGEAPRIGDLLPNEQVGRLYLGNLGRTIEKIGLLPTVDFILPLLFPPTILPTEIIAQCRRAIELRNTIVHHGQRNIVEDETRSLINAVIEACKIIIEYTMRE
jgi:hypothetical protein